MVHPWNPTCSSRVARALRLGLCLAAVWPAAGAARAPGVAPSGQKVPSVAPPGAAAAGPSLPSEIRVRGRIAPPPAAGFAAVQALRVEAVDVAAEPDAVRARRLFAGAPEPPPLASTHPDATGAFELRLPTGGFYRLRLEAAGFLALALDLAPLLEDVDLPAAELAPAGAPLKVTVLDAAGHPAACVLAGIRRLRTPATPQAPPDPSAIDAAAGSWHPARRVGVTAADGTLQLPRVRGEAVEIMASDDGWPPAAMVAGEAPAAILRLASRPRRSLDVRLAGGEPAAGALVRQGGFWIGLTGLDGRLAVAMPAKGAVTLSVRSVDGQAAEVPWPAAGAAVTGQLPVVLRPPRVVAGRVVDAATRQPLAGALVLGDLGPPARTATDGEFRLLAPEAGEVEVQAFAIRHLALRTSLPPPAAADPALAATDHDGRFTIGNLAPGPHTLLLSNGSRGIGYVRQIEVVDPGNGGQQPELALAFATGAMTGRVALPDGSPVAGATVQLERPDAAVFGPFPGPERLTDEGGAFAVPYLLAGTWQVTVTRDGTVLAQASVEVQPHQTAILELAPAPAAAAPR